MSDVWVEEWDEDMEIFEPIQKPEKMKQRDSLGKRERKQHKKLRNIRKKRNEQWGE